MDFLRDIRRRADEVALEADKALRVQRKQSEVNQLQKQIQQKLHDLGSAAYALHQDGQTLAPPLAQICQNIDSLFAAVRVSQDEIETIRREALPPMPIAGGQSCMSCGRPLPANAAFCQHCGARVPEPPAMIPCPHCGTALPADARFCANCGQTVTGQPAPVAPASAPAAPTCPQCGTEVVEGAAFCEECGAALQAEPVVAPEVAQVHPVGATQPELEMARDQVKDGAISVTAKVQAQKESSDEPVYCATCAAEIPAGAPFCAVCGAAIADAA